MMTPPRVDNSALQAQIESIGARMEKGFDELKAIWTGYDGRLRVLEQSDASNHPLMSSRLDAAWRTIDEHSTDIKTVTKTAGDALAIAKRLDDDSTKRLDAESKRFDDINKIANTALIVATRLESVAKYLLALITAVITALIIAVLTGKIKISFG